MKQKLKSVISGAMPSLGMFAAALLLSRARFIASCHPFGFAFFAASGGNPFCAVGMILGLMSAGADLIITGRYIFSAAIFMAVYPGIRQGKLPFVSKEQAAAAAGIIIPSVGLFLLFISMSVGGYPLLYDCIILFSEAAAVFVGTVAFSKALPLLGMLHIRRTLTGEETLCLSLFMGAVISGFCGIAPFKSFDLGEAAAVFVTIAYAVRFGSLHGGVVGAVLGMICSVSGKIVTAAPASFAISGISAGYFGKKGKLAACGAFILSNAVVTALANGSSEVLISLSCSLGGSLLLFALPPSLFKVIETAAPQPSAENIILRDGLSRLHDALAMTKSALVSLSASKEETESALKETLYNRTARRVCYKCGLKKYCWGRDGKNTRDAMDSLALACGAGNKNNSELSPSHCIRPDTFAEEFGKMYDLYRCDLVWSLRRRELQQSLSSLFEGFGSALERAVSQSDSPRLCDELLADDIRSRLRKKGIEAAEIFVTGSHEETEVRIKLRSCGELGCCEELVPEILNQATGLKFAKLGLKDCHSCRCRYVVAPEYDIEAAVASAVKENRRTSGDFSTCCLLSRTTFAIALCDGCGSGEAAAAESRLCGRLLISLLEAGLTPEDAIGLTNSMIIGSGNGTYTAMDLCIVELGGAAKLYKCGTAASYLRQNGLAAEISPAGVPVGTKAVSGAECYECAMDDESTLVLISDGVALAQSSENPWIKELIENGGIATAQKLASEILNKARDASGGVPADDLTVIAANIRRKQA